MADWFLQRCLHFNRGEIILSPELNNVFMAALAIIYVFAVVAIMDFAVKKGFPQHLSRKVIHIAAGSWLIFWFLFDHSHWTKYLNIAPAFIWTVLLLIKGFSARPDDEAVKTMTRTGDRKELLRGPLYFTIIMNLMGTFFFYTPFAITSMGLLGWGDGLAPVFGQKFGKHPFKILAEKTIEGSLAFLIFGFFGASLFHFILLGTIPFTTILYCTLVSTIIEAVSPRDLDNILIPVACGAVYLILQ
ncbi:MAG: diacylglycerol/polyprenol kinase family protein [bacterium]